MGECILSYLRLFQRWLFILTLLVAGSVLQACSNQQPTPLPTAIPVENPTAQPTQTATPTFTPTPEQPLVILLAEPDADPSLIDALQARLSEFATQEDLRFETRSQVSPSDLESDVRLVVATAPDPGVAALAAAAPQVQFLAVGIPDIEPAANLSSVDAGEMPPDQLGFAAGYLAATITEDWRVGVISEADTVAGNAAKLGFTNGVYYMCGLCRPVNPPYPIPGYPLVAQLSPGAGQAEWQSAVDIFQEWQVGTVYIAPEVAEPGLMQELADVGIQIIGTQAPPAGLKANWVASLGLSDPVDAVNTLLPSLLDGQGEQSIQLPVTLSEINSELLSPGRQRLVEEMLVDLTAGYIDTGVNPETGESSH